MTHMKKKKWWGRRNYDLNLIYSTLKTSKKSTAHQPHFSSTGVIWSHKHTILTKILFQRWKQKVGEFINPLYTFSFLVLNENVSGGDVTAVVQSGEAASSALEFLWAGSEHSGSGCFRIALGGVFYPTDYGLISETSLHRRLIHVVLFCGKEVPTKSREHDDPLGEGEGPETQRAAPGHPVQNAEGGGQQVLRRLRGERCDCPSWNVVNGFAQNSPLTPTTNSPPVSSARLTR